MASKYDFLGNTFWQHPLVERRPRWEERLIETTEDWPGWSVMRGGKKRDRITIRFRLAGSPVETVTLPRPLEWNQQSQKNATRWIEQLYVAWDHGSKTLKGALEELKPRSEQQGQQHAVTWDEIAQALRESRVKQSERCSYETFDKNWMPFITVANQLIKSGTVHDGYTLLEAALKHWPNAPTMKVECGRYLGIYMRYAVSRHRAPGSWLIEEFDKDELIPKPPPKRLKAVMSDAQLIHLVEVAHEENPAWGNVFRLLTQYGLRPCELSHISVRQHPVRGVPALWCNYKKRGGMDETDPRWLVPMYLRNEDDEPFVWPLEQALIDKNLKLPVGNDGKTRKLSGSSINCHLHRKNRKTGEPAGPLQQLWHDMSEEFAQRTPSEWLRAYSFRDSYSVRCHRENVPTNSICEAMGHSEAVHYRSYRVITADIVTRDFAAETAVKNL